MKSGSLISPLEAHNLSIGYGTTVVAEKLDLTLQAGEFVCLLGPNGTGKSTLIRTLSSMQAPLEGQLLLRGTPFTEMRPRERAKQVSVVLTDPLPAGMMPAYALVALGRHPYSGWLGGLNAHDHECIAQAFQAVGASHLARRQITELSDGERQKISIARALAQEASVMLLDEPTAFLDLPRRIELMTILRDLAHRENMALLLSTHDLDLALRFADRLWIMSASAELVQGFPEELALDGRFAKVFKSENLDWDMETGSFKVHPKPRLNVQIQGEGMGAIWTKRALSRLGFGIASPAEKVRLKIFVQDGDSGPRWQVSAEGEKLEDLASIAELIEWMRSQPLITGKKE